MIYRFSHYRVFDTNFNIVDQACIHTQSKYFYECTENRIILLSVNDEVTLNSDLPVHSMFVGNIICEYAIPNTISFLFNSWFNIRMK